MEGFPEKIELFPKTERFIQLAKQIGRRIFYLPLPEKGYHSERRDLQAESDEIIMEQWNKGLGIDK